MNPIVPFVLHLLASLKRAASVEDVARLMAETVRPCHETTVRYALDEAFACGLVARDVRKLYWLTPEGSDVAAAVSGCRGPASEPDLPGAGG